MSKPRLSRLALLFGLAVAAVSAQPAQGETLLRHKFEVGQKSLLVMTQEMQMKMKTTAEENPSV